MSIQNKQVFFPVLIGVAIGFLAGFLTALQWQPGEVMTASPVTKQAAANPPNAKSNMPEGHPEINLQSDIDKLIMQLRDRPKDAVLLSTIGNLYFDGGRHGEATPYYEKALEVQPNDYAIRTDLATCYYNTGQNERALKELDQVLAKKPDFNQALYNYGVIKYFGMNDSQAAITAWEKLIASNPQYPGAAQVKENLVKLKAGKKLS